MLFKNQSKCLSANPDFIYDEACLDILNTLSQNVTILYQYDECNRCEDEVLATLGPMHNTSVLVDTKYALNLKYAVGTQEDNSTCHISKVFYEHYRFGLNITKECSSIFIKQPADSAYLPILTAFIILFMFGTIWYMVKCIYKCTKSSERWRQYLLFYKQSELEHDLGSPVASGSTQLILERPPPIRKHPNRVKSIDVFRGLCIMLMIFVNYGGGRYYFFMHSVWNGITFADLVFPWFLWLMGMSMMISLNKKLRHGMPRRQMVVQVIRRSLILILLGLICNSHGNLATLATLRYPGILQRIGVCYLVVGLLEVAFAKRMTSVEYGRLSVVQDMIAAWPQWLFVICIVTLHTLITFFLDVPGCGAGYLGAGGLDDLGKHENCTGGAAGYIDRSIFGPHVYRHATCKAVYETPVNYDPEGILGTLPAILMVYLGVQAGRTLHSFSDVRTRVLRWVTTGLVLGILGGLLCGFSKNDGPIPLNKNLFSLSFVLLLSGMAFVIEAFLFVVVDITRKWGGRPLFYPGMNPIILYLGHEVMRNTFPFEWTPEQQTHASYLGMNLWGMGLWVVVSVYMYKNNIFFAL